MLGRFARWMFHSSPTTLSQYLWGVFLGGFCLYAVVTVVSWLAQHGFSTGGGSLLLSLAAYPLALVAPLLDQLPGYGAEDPFASRLETVATVALVSGLLLAIWRNIFAAKLLAMTLFAGCALAGVWVLATGR